MGLNTDLTTGGLVALAGGVLALVSALLPWFAAGVQAGPVDISGPAVTGIDTTSGVIVLLAGLAVGAAAVLLEWDVRTMAAAAVGGALVAVLALLTFADLGGVTGARVGLYLALVGGVLMLVGGAVGYQRTDDDLADPLGA